MSSNPNHAHGLQLTPTEHYATHRNGHGKLLGTQIHTSHDSYIDATSVVAGKTIVVGSTIVNSTITNSVIFGASIADSVVNECIITPLYGKSPLVAQVEITKAVIEGDTTLIGFWTLIADQVEARIPCGVWYKPPQYLEIVGESAVPGFPVKVGITESTEGHALIACMRKPLNQWLGKDENHSPGRRLGRAKGWTDSQTLEVYRFFESLRS